MLIGRFSPLEAGAEIQCRRLSRELVARGNPVLVLTQALPGAQSEDKVDTVPVYRVGATGNKKINSLVYVIAGFFWLLKRRTTLDVLHAHMASSPALLAAFAGKVFRKPTLLKFAGSRATGDVATSSATWYGRLKLLLLRAFIGYFVCPSNEIRRELVRAGFPESKITVIPNGVDTTQFRPASPEEKNKLRQALGLPLNGTIILYSGRLEQGKGVEILVSAWQALQPAQKAHLIIVGDGSLRSGLEQQARATSTPVIFFGWQENVEDFLRASDIFVLPSFGEGMPNSLLEAMACGLLCIATDIGGITELLRDKENGLLVPPRDTAALTAALRILLTDSAHSRTMGENARACMEKDLSLSIIASRYATLYQQLSAGH